MKLGSKLKLQYNIWFYLIIFSVLILVFLWLFQVIFFKTYYQYMKIKELNSSVNKLENNFNNNLMDYLDTLSHDKGVCIEIVEYNKLIYSSSSFNRGCLVTSIGGFDYKVKFITSGLNRDNYHIINPKFNNENLVSALKINNYTYAFISASLEPLDSAVSILKNQLIYITLIVLILSFIIAYYISMKISNPIIKINNATKEMAEGNYNVVFGEKTNILEISELEDTLNYMKEELSKTEELRMELLSNVSHDLKTPLTMIKAYAEMIRDLTYKNKEKRTSNLNTIIEESDRLNLLVNDILTLSTVESKIDNLHYEKIDLIELINNIIKRYDILVEKDNYEFIFNHPNKAVINADKKQIEQVIYNLINNAINYTGDDNKVIVNVTNDKTIRVEITDTGKGINEKDINFIWDRYYHSDKKHKRNLIGTGLGLSIVKNILINHHFKYGVISKKNKGTTFYFEIED